MKTEREEAEEEAERTLNTSGREQRQGKAEENKSNTDETELMCCDREGVEVEGVCRGPYLVCLLPQQLASSYAV